jgi:2-aminoethylphosphonate-pyruvate transaminase
MTGCATRVAIIPPGKLTVADGFRIGCISQLHEAEMKGALAAIKATLGEMGVSQCGRAKAA